MVFEVDKNSVKYKQVKVNLSNGDIRSGRINIQMCNRVSDFLNNDKSFIVLMEDLVETPLIINKQYIMFIEVSND